MRILSPRNIPPLNVGVHVRLPGVSLHPGGMIDTVPSWCSRGPGMGSNETPLLSEEELRAKILSRPGVRERIREALEAEPPASDGSGISADDLPNFLREFERSSVDT